MATTVPAIARAGLVRRGWLANKPLTAVGVGMLAVLGVSIVGLLIDPTVITGAPAWLKPAKFALSIAIYSFTFLWLLTYVDGHPRLVRAAAWTTAVAFGIEMVLIAGAAMQGTTSHFNVSTPVHAAIWSVMGSAIVAAWVANLAVLVLLLRQRFADAAFAWSLRLGVLVSAVGMGVAFLMTSPSAQQLAQARAGAGMPIVGAHAVGVPDGGPGLPIVGWSTVGGDLRVPHFAGLHALQVLPLLGVLLTRFAPRWLTIRDRLALIWTAGLTYLSALAILTWQALRGQPLIRPDRATLEVAALAAAAAIAATVTVLVRARRRTGG